ncbi:MAG: malto-oligosyltrehalose synthase, partial [Pseudomonadota bacterium]
ETVPEEWPISGTTGYDFLGRVNSLLVDERGLKKLKGVYDHFVGTRTDLSDVIIEKKTLIMQSLFGGEIETFEYQLRLLADQDRQARDVSRHDLLKALMEVTACLPIYRTYIRELEISTTDRRVLEETLQRVEQRNPRLNPQVLQFLRRVLLLQFPAGFSWEHKQGWLRFVRRWQQFTGPIMAKGLEDTALYVYNPLISLNEVGGSHRALSIEAFHRFNQERQRLWPLTMNASSTHDTKRSEDVRARISVLSEIPTEWEACLKRWVHWNLPKKTILQDLPVPDLNEEIFLYQTLIGAWPLFEGEEEAFKERLKAYLLKAAREAKVHTRWITPNEDYENALLAFVEAILEKSEQNYFLPDFRKVQSRLAYYGALNSLSQLLLKITSPGIPDFYQGTELWDFSLVDPDNRRPVDFEKRFRLLRELTGRGGRDKEDRVRELLNHWKDGRIKLFITQKALRFRKKQPALFLGGEYIPLAAEGNRKKQVVSFARTKGPEWVITGVGRFYSQFTSPGTFPLGPESWGKGCLGLPPEAPKYWQDILTGERLTTSIRNRRPVLPLGELFNRLPVTLLYGRADGVEGGIF